MPDPIKRHKTLQPISREHHHGLLLSWKIRQGLKFKVSTTRIKKYTEWFWHNHLNPHFVFEEKYMFPILGNEHESVKKALKDHERLTNLLSDTNNMEGNLSLIEEAIVAHIRFEERILFNELEQAATEEQLKIIDFNHSENPIEDWHDAFWLRSKASFN